MRALYAVTYIEFLTQFLIRLLCKFCAVKRAMSDKRNSIDPPNTFDFWDYSVELECLEGGNFGRFVLFLNPWTPYSHARPQFQF